MLHSGVHDELTRRPVGDAATSAGPSHCSSRDEEPDHLRETFDISEGHRSTHRMWYARCGGLRTQTPAPCRYSRIFESEPTGAGSTCIQQRRTIEGQVDRAHPGTGSR